MRRNITTTSLKVNPKMSSSSDRTQTSCPQDQKPLRCLLGISRDWQNLPDRVFGDVMMMFGVNKLEAIPKCRQVCQIWNVMISQMTKLKKDTIRREAESQAAKIRDKWALPYKARLPDIKNAASLAHHGLLGSVHNLLLIDLPSIPFKHLASLASCVRNGVFIFNIRNCDIVSLLDSVNFRWLNISTQTLSSEETRALVRAMESGVERVVLGKVCQLGDVSLDITALTKYSGQGKCWEVRYNDTGDRYREELRSLAEKINWKVSLDDTFTIVIARK